MLYCSTVKNIKYGIQSERTGVKFIALKADDSFLILHPHMVLWKINRSIKVYKEINWSLISLPSCCQVSIGKVFISKAVLFKSEAPKEPEYSKSLKSMVLFIRRLNFEMTDEYLRIYFDQWVRFIDCSVIRDPNTKCSQDWVCYSGESGCIHYTRLHTVDRIVVGKKSAVSREDSQRSGASLTW